MAKHKNTRGMKQFRLFGNRNLFVSSGKGASLFFAVHAIFQMVMVAFENN
jgi:hypothetical protein